MDTGSALPSLLNIASERDLLRILECPVCQDVMSPPVYQCATGHSICNICKPKLTECPLCKGKLSGVRNFIVEQIISSSVHECIYKADGCKATAKGELIEEHIKACGFRPHQCPFHLFNDCKENVKHADILQHLKSKHKLEEKSSLSGEAEIRFNIDQYIKSDLKIDPNSHILACHGNKFLVCMLNSQRYLHWAILLIANEAREGRYCGKIVLKLEEKRDTRWNFPIVSIFNQTAMEYVLGGFGCTGLYDKRNIYHMCSTRDQLCAELKVTFKIRSSTILFSNPNKQPARVCVCGEKTTRTRVGLGSHTGFSFTNPNQQTTHKPLTTAPDVSTLNTFGTFGNPTNVLSKPTRMVLNPTFTGFGDTASGFGTLTPGTNLFGPTPQQQPKPFTLSGLGTIPEPALGNSTFSWTCICCTYVNSSPGRICEVCRRYAD